MKQFSDKKRFPAPLIGLLILIGCTGDLRHPQGLFTPIGFSYPRPFRDSLYADTLHGTAVPDPYRWMEAEKAPILEEWISEERNLAEDYLTRIPFRKAVEKRMRDLWDYERIQHIRKQGDFLYFLKNTGLEDYDVLVRQHLQEEKEEAVMPALPSPDLGQLAFSPDNRFLAFEKRENGSEWRTIHVWDLLEQKLLPDTLRWVRYSQMAWAGNGFYYSRYPAPARGDKTASPLEFHQVFYHEVGNRQSEDQLIFADRARSKRCFRSETSLDGRFLIVNIWETNSGNGVYVLDRKKENSEFIFLADDMANYFEFIGSMGDHLLFLTDFEADKRRLIKVSTQKPGPGFWETIIPEKPDLLQDVYLAGGKLVAHYLRDAQHFLQIYEPDGAESTILTMQEAGTISQFNGHPEEDRAFFSFESFLSPPTIYELDLNLLTARIFKAPKINFNKNPYETRLVFIKNQESQEDIPLFITMKKGMKHDRQRPTLLLGDGGMGHCMTPQFDPAFLCILENEGVIAQAVLKGGGEYGRKWHEGGVRSKRRQTFQDFQAAARYLVEEGYTSPEKLAIRGRGASGGLLAGVTATQRPDICRVVIAESGAFDLIRYQQFTIGGEWAYDFGRIDEPREFDFLLAFSPVHNARAAEYPAMLVMASESDSQVYPAHAYKFAAELQYRQKSPLPVLFLPEKGYSGTVAQQTGNCVDWLSFMYFHLRHPVVYDLK